MRKHLIRSGVLIYFMLLQLIVVNQVHALPPLSNGPLFLGGNISPNVMFTLDDSGSMHFEIMPQHLILNDVRYMFPRATNVYGGGSDYNNYVIDFDSANKYTASLRSSHVNKIYYDPSVWYQPWSNADGSLMSNASPTCAPHNPKDTAKGCRNLTVNNTQTAQWMQNNGTRTSNQSKIFYPAVYFKYIGGSVNSASSFMQVEIKSSTSSYTGGPDRLDCAAAPVCTYAEEIQNFANWYTYYRSRILLARAGIGKAFAAQGNTMRVGFAAINKGEATIDGVSTKVIVKGVRQFVGADRTSFFKNLYEYPIPAAGTPLRNSVDQVGKYFMRDDATGPWSETPGVSGGVEHECRQNYNILMTDGYWHDSDDPPPPGIGNVDNTAGSLITNHSSPAIPPTYTYTPALPFADNHSNTLADVAMHYWKNDLRPDLPNNVPTNTADPAFWQHMVTFTVGLGVSGALTALPSESETWPDPGGEIDTPAKIDDLWHAAVNSRGQFFSAADPNVFARALSDALSTIVARTGAASAVAANSNSLTTNGRIYQAKFNSGEWSGQLLSIPIDAMGTVGAPEWDAGSVSLASASVNPATRVLITKGNADGVAFEYANLPAAQKALLDKNAVGSIDNCGPERVAYLRGASLREGSTGTFNCASGETVNKFRVRTTSKLGDIVNSTPFYVGGPVAGYSDVDHPGYAAFNAAYKNRLPMVYVGANDGMLHGFNACIPDITPGCSAADAGKEMIAYIPSMVYTNLNRLTDKDYNANHRFFVNGSPMVADAYLSGALGWRTVLVGGLNGGGKGYFALDITNPVDASQPGATFTTANAASLLLWEFSDADDADMGYSYNQPAMEPVTGQSRQIVKMENGQWAVIVGNGYNSDNGKAVLYILFLTGGEDGSWTLGTDYIKLVANAGPGNGLSTPVPFDSNGNGLVDVIYAGDIKGNLWRFDVSSASPASWNVGIGGQPLFAGGISKPIIAPPTVSLHPNGGQLIIFGTGKYLETGDTTNTDTQTIYGIWDHATSATVTGGQLVQQVITDAEVRTATQLPVNYSASTKGWYFDLPVSGERLTGVSTLRNGMFIFSTIIPSVSPCDFGGQSFVNAVDFLTGGMLPFPAFDINNNNRIGSDDGLSAGIVTGFSEGGLRVIEGSPRSTTSTVINNEANGSLNDILIANGPAGLRGRITWRELMP